MLLHAEIVHIYLKNIYYSLSRQGEACKYKIDAGKTLPSVSLNGVRLRSVSQFWIVKIIPKIFRKINIWTLDSLEMEMLESKK